MESVYKFLKSKISKKSIPDAISTLQFLLFNNFYNILYHETDEKYKLTVSGKEIFINGNLEGVDLIDMFFKHANLYCDTQFIVELKRQYRIKNGKLTQIVYPPVRFLTNISNSCAIDSLLCIILFAKSGYYLKQIVDSTDNTYPPWIDVETITRLSNRVRDNILNLYNSLPSCGDKNVEMGNARSIQQDLVYYLKEDCTDVKAAYELWNTLCIMYNKLHFSLLTKRHSDIRNDPTVYAALPYGEDTFIKSIIKPPHLVIVNDTIVEDYTFEVIKGYELVGVVIHTGGHYYSRVKIYDDWYLYDDLNSRIVRRMPTNLLSQSRSARNVMMFYVQE